MKRCISAMLLSFLVLGISQMAFVAERAETRETHKFSLKVKLEDNTTGSPVINLKVLVRAGGETLGEKRTDQDGWAAFSGLKTDQDKIKIEGAGFNRSLSLTSGKTDYKMYIDI